MTRNTEIVVKIALRKVLTNIEAGRIDKAKDGIDAVIGLIDRVGEARGGVGLPRVIIAEHQT